MNGGTIGKYGPNIIHHLPITANHYAFRQPETEAKNPHLLKRKHNVETCVTGNTPPPPARLLRQRRQWRGRRGVQEGAGRQILRVAPAAIRVPAVRRGRREDRDGGRERHPGAGRRFERVHGPRGRAGADDPGGTGGAEWLPEQRRQRRGRPQGGAADAERNQGCRERRAAEDDRLRRDGAQCLR